MRRKILAVAKDSNMHAKINVELQMVIYEDLDQPEKPIVIETKTTTFPKRPRIKTAYPTHRAFATLKEACEYYSYLREGHVTGIVKDAFSQAGLKFEKVCQHMGWTPVYRLKEENNDA